MENKYTPESDAKYKIKKDVKIIPVSELLSSIYDKDNKMVIGSNSAKLLTNPSEWEY